MTTPNLAKLDLSRWPLNYADMWRERAAILEYEAGIPRDQAETLAREIVVEMARKEQER